MTARLTCRHCATSFDHIFSRRVHEAWHGRDHDLPGRFWRKVTRTTPDECWQWNGSTSDDGYGCVKDGAGRSAKAHRVAYEMERGPVPEGLEIDHLCRNRACVNPAHMEPVTHLENMARGAHALKTSCPLGHPYDIVDNCGRRRCRSCLNRLHALRRRAVR